MRVLAIPRDPNPYQGLLYSEMQRLGFRITYIAELTPSHTLNLLLLPFEVAARRLAGARLIHLHWIFVFAFPGTRRFPIMRRAAHIWFVVWLRTCRLLGMHLIWTAHNVLPHEQVFADDVSGRRTLVKASDLVLAHSPSALTELAALGARPRRSSVIGHGPIAPKRITAPRSTCDARDGLRRFLFFGRVQEYKGADDLLRAFLALPDDIAAHLTVAGQCDNPRLRSRLCGLAREGGGRVVLRLEQVPEDEVTMLFTAADVVVLPFRRVTTSGSAMLALSHGRPLIVPDLPGLADLPDQAVLRYSGGVPALSASLARLARAEGRTLAAMSAAASQYTCSSTWQEIAEKTVAEMLSVLADDMDKETQCQEYL